MSSGLDSTWGPDVPLLHGVPLRTKTEIRAHYGDGFSIQVIPEGMLAQFDYEGSFPVQIYDGGREPPDLSGVWLSSHRVVFPTIWFIHDSIIQWVKDTPGASLLLQESNGFCGAAVLPHLSRPIS